ncbi:hypothetical protein [Parvibaculum sp.]|uniref:hypothetical protein n=1 Tax=Parvibaculum sp. TaxID=2024848 RepID=UPI001B2AC057|nr:hypothetical protein [Parvibaculum sp.]MBO6633986.1 hypothetical protein [Parvibaculum sp.]MBO6680042.1 hypothetical protein [Parvibaculum sp.]MBO6683629.1 hypothetical protein [Parvibaculum sp.]MBO6904767.1 hypothetical protein [Parvibaculum sp.]
MKNVQIIDGADNCTYSIYGMTQEEFDVVFAEAGQDVEFVEDLVIRLGDSEVAALLAPVWERGAVDKPDVAGIHGTLFFGLLWKKKYYPTKKDAEMVAVI